jgi:hypothetical protein
MTRTRHRPLLAVVAVFALAGCATAGPSGSPSGVPSLAPTASVAATAAAPTTTPSPTPATTPNASPDSVACDLRPQTVGLPSDRLTGMQVFGMPGRDIVQFQFGNGSLTPAGPPVGSLTAAVPPFTEGASGRPIDLKGEQAVQVVFRGMSLSNDVGEPTYTGQRQLIADDTTRSLREAVLFDESEGQVGWYIGYDQPACVQLLREGDAILVVLDFGPGAP